MSQQSPYVSSACVPQCIAKDAAYLTQSLRTVCYHNVTVDQPIPVKVVVKNLTTAALSTATLTTLDTGSTFVFGNSSQINTLTLPSASGENLGVHFNFLVTSASATSHIIKAAGTDKIKGSVVVGSATASANTVSNAKVITAGASDVQINLNTGTSNAAGAVGSVLSLVVVEKGKWQVTGSLVSADTAANTGSGIFT